MLNNLRMTRQLSRIQFLCLLNLLPENALEGVCVGRKLADTLAKLVHRHGLLVEIETEETLVVQVVLLLDIEAAGVRSVKLLGHRILAVIKVLEQIWLKNGQCTTFTKHNNARTEMVR